MRGTIRTPRRLHCVFFTALFILYLFHTSLLYRYYNRIAIGIGDVKQVGAGVVRHSSSSSFSLDNKPNNGICDKSSNASTSGGIIGESVFRHWNYIDTTIEKDFPLAKVSGGIFLYPRQASILTHLIKRIHTGLKDRRKMITICETGYGSGHSMVLFQEASISVGPVRVVSFDKFDRPYQLPIWHHFNETISASSSHLQERGYSNKKTFDSVMGDSCKTVPKYLPSFQCDILHGSSLCPTDNIDLVENSPCGVLLTSTAMNSLNDRQVYFGPNAQWRKLRQRDCISNIICFQEDDILDLQRDFIFAKRGSTQTGKFCIAITTGKCQKDKVDILNDYDTIERCTAEINQLVTQLDLNETCPQHQIEAPV